VIATAFPHAIELLSSGAGIVVPQRDANALAEVVRGLIAEPDELARMAAECRRLAPELSWPSVARRYDDLAASLFVAGEVRA
jgi:glycosyltransferase involved in cell wall biosynthesis